VEKFVEQIAHSRGIERSSVEKEFVETVRSSSLLKHFASIEEVRRRHADTRHPIDLQSGLWASLTGHLRFQFAITNLDISCALISA